MGGAYGLRPAVDEYRPRAVQQLAGVDGSRVGRRVDDRGDPFGQQAGDCGVALRRVIGRVDNHADVIGGLDGVLDALDDATGVRLGDDAVGDDPDGVRTVRGSDCAAGRAKLSWAAASRPAAVRSATATSRRSSKRTRSLDPPSTSRHPPFCPPGLSLVAWPSAYLLRADCEDPHRIVPRSGACYRYKYYWNVSHLLEHEIVRTPVPILDGSRRSRTEPDCRQIRSNEVVDLSRRAMLGAIGLGIVGTAVSWPRLTARDIPGRGEDALTITVFGTAQDAVQRQGLVDGFQKLHPDIPVRIVAVQGQDWGSYFAKILTMIAAGTPPDVVTTATEGTQLFASRMASRRRVRAARAADIRSTSRVLLAHRVVPYKGTSFPLPDNSRRECFYNNSALEGQTRAAERQLDADDSAPSPQNEGHRPGTFMPYSGQTGCGAGSPVLDSTRPLPHRGEGYRRRVAVQQSTERDTSRRRLPGGEG